MNLAQIQLADISHWPVWAQILFAMTAVIISIAGIIKTWQSGKWQNVAQQNEKELLEIKAQRDRELSQTEMNKQFLSLFRDELNSVTSAIREAATIRREDDNITRQQQERNTAVISELNTLIKGLTDPLTKMTNVMNNVLETNKAINHNMTVLSSGVTELSGNVEQQITTLSELRHDVSELKEVVNAHTPAVEELFNKLDKRITELSVSIQHNSDTRELPETLLAKLEDALEQLETTNDNISQEIQNNG